MLLDLFRYWKVKLKIKFSPQIPIPLGWHAWIRQTLDRAVERQNSKEQWEEIWQAQRQRTGSDQSVLKNYP